MTAATPDIMLPATVESPSNSQRLFARYLVGALIDLVVLNLFAEYWSLVSVSTFTISLRIASPFIWECTRFCLAPDGTAGVAAALLVAGVELGLRFGLDQAVGVVYAKTVPLYRRIGSMPDIIGSDGNGRDEISVGLWPITVEARAEISRKSGIPLSVIARWFDASFGVEAAMSGGASADAAEVRVAA